MTNSFYSRSLRVVTSRLRDVNYIHPSATITSPHRPPSLTIQNNYAASVFYGEFNTTTDTDFFKFNMPFVPEYKDGYVAGFRPVSAGPNGDGSSSRVGSLAVFDASGMKTLASANLSMGETPELRVLLQAGTEYYLRVRQPAGTVAGNNFYFVYYYPESPIAVEPAERVDVHWLDVLADTRPCDGHPAVRLRARRRRPRGRPKGRGRARSGGAPW